MFHFETYTSSMRSEHLLCSILKIILLTRPLNNFCVPIWHEHPFLIFYYENLPFEASFFTQTPRTPRTQPNTPKPPQKNTFPVPIWPEHPFLLKGIWGVWVRSGCSGCLGEKTKHQKAGFHTIKLKKGVWVKSEHKRYSGFLLAALFTKWNTKGVRISC